MWRTRVTDLTSAVPSAPVDGSLSTRTLSAASSGRAVSLCFCSFGLDWLTARNLSTSAKHPDHSFNAETGSSLSHNSSVLSVRVKYRCGLVGVSSHCPTWGSSEGDHGSTVLPDDLQTVVAVIQTHRVLHQHGQEVSGHVVGHVVQHHRHVLNAVRLWPEIQKDPCSRQRRIYVSDCCEFQVLNLILFPTQPINQMSENMRTSQEAALPSLLSPEAPFEGSTPGFFESESDTEKKIEKMNF